ncbi:MAG: chloride channel protein [Burkholderiales bacterium]|nr:chloride channel protein [Burkholderiales bacterium]
MDKQKADSHTHAALPISPNLDSALLDANMARSAQLLDQRMVWLSGLAMGLGVLAAFVAYVLTHLIGFVTNIAFYGRLSTEFTSPAHNQLGAWVILVPAIGGLIVGFMAKWGSKAIRGHGIPEAMEQILRNESRIPARITWLKPVSSAVVIGTGGPFGAEGPIIATGGALGSLLGQLIHVTADERKILLAAGAAAGMAAIFSAPVSAVLLAVELLLFERRARSLIPVALAAAAATAIRYRLEGTEAVFAMAAVATPGTAALVLYTLLGALLGAIGVGITKLTYGIEDAFEKLPVHWVYWPALGGLVVGAIGYIDPQTLGVGYDNIAAILNGRLAVGALAILAVLKFVSWSIALGSGTSGGTLAPLFTVGGALGGILGALLATWLPALGMDPRIAALVGMAAIFAGASRAFLASVVFAFETTQQPHGLLPLLSGCAAAYLVSGLLMRHTIMTEKITRRGVRVPSDYSADYLDQVTVGDICSRDVAWLESTQRIGEVRKWIDEGHTRAQHQGFPVFKSGTLIGVVTRKDLLKPSIPGDACVEQLVHRPALVVQESHSAREAADHMVEAHVGRLVVLADGSRTDMVGIVTRGDLLAAHSQRIKEARQTHRHLTTPFHPKN